MKSFPTTTVVRGNTIATVIVDDKKYYYHPCLLELVKKEMKASPSDTAFWSDAYKTIQQKIKQEEAENPPAEEPNNPNDPKNDPNTK